jgi:methionine sulfoxide reductase heme-binding subunit
VVLSSDRPWTPPRWLAPVVVVAALAPGLWQSFALASDFLWRTRYLGTDPIETLEHSTGIWAIRFLVVTLAITPLRRMTGANWLQPYRKRFGLVAFTYALLHVVTYVGLDIQLHWPTLLGDFTKRPYIIVGGVTFLILLSLAVTSTAGWVKRLGKRWVQLHKAVYIAAVLAVVHFWMSQKADIREPLVFALIFVALLAYRAWTTRRSLSALRASSPSSSPSSAASA